MKTSKQRREQRKRAKARMTLVNYKTRTKDIFDLDMLDQMFNLVPLPVPPSYSHKRKEKEENMYTDTDNNIETRQRDHMLRRAAQIYYSKENVAARTFHLVDDDYPDTFKELKARLDAGQYVVDEEADKRGYGALSAVRWRDPTKPADRPGYDAWQKLLRTKYVATKDQIVVMPVEAGLKALQDFEAATIQ